MGHGHGNGVDPGDEVDVQLLHDVHHRAGEPFPLQVRFEAGQEEERLPQPVHQPVERQPGLLVILDVVFDEAQVRAP